MTTNIRSFTAPLGLLSVAFFLVAVITAILAMAANGAEVKPVTVVVASSSTAEFDGVVDVKWARTLAKKGVTVDMKYFEGEPKAYGAVLAGAADISHAGITAVAQLAQLHGDGILNVIVNILQTTDYVLMTQPGITKLSDLEGKAVGISAPGGLSDTLTRAMLRHEGIDTDKVNFVQIGGTGARIKALAVGQIDAAPAHIAEALAFEGKSELKLLWNFGRSLPQFVQKGLSARPEWLAENRELAQLLVDTMLDTLRWAATNKEEYIALSKEVVEDMPSDVRLKAYDKFIEVNLFAVNGAMTDEDMNGTITVSQEVGALEDDVPPFEKWIDASFVEDYLKRNGKQ